jgi:SAM-dependent methyltransferase
VKSFLTASYESNAESYRPYARGGVEAEHARTWLESDTVDAWRHARMYAVLDPFLAAAPAAEWLTVGDGRWGNDARYILQRGGKALATDISGVLLEQARSEGLIPDYRVENAEKLSFGDEQFDYVFCKESYHHFPRPMLALYEMLRVARKAVVLFEPNDLAIGASSFRRALHQRARALLGRPASGAHAFEDCGNYVFTISRREMEKVAAGANLPGVAFKGLNDAYVPGVEHEKLASDGPLQRQVRRSIAKQDLLCRLGITDYGCLGTAIFKSTPSAAVQEALAVHGHELILLPENPYAPSGGGNRPR